MENKQLKAVYWPSINGKKFERLPLPSTYKIQCSKSHTVKKKDILSLGQVQKKFLC